jgi:hypothetical protein
VVEERSTRFSIVEHALGDVVERLRELEPSQQTTALAAQARALEAEVVLWSEHPPGEEVRIELLKRVLDLNIEIIRAGGGGRSKTDPHELSPDDLESDDDYPRSL